MKISPRYDAAPPVVLECDTEMLRTAAVRQRRRVSALLADLDAAQWATPSRCDGWSVRDVAAHLIDTDRFWAMSIDAGLAGDPTRILDGFDPVATPKDLLAAFGEATGAEVAARHDETGGRLCDVIASLDGADWAASAESPAGHVPVSAVVHHALWDSWVHERDIRIPLGMDLVEEPDEVIACLAYCAGLAPTLALLAEPGRVGSLVLEATDPRARIVVDAGEQVRVRFGEVAPANADPVVVGGSAAQMLECLSMRAPFSGDLAATDSWLVVGLADQFESGTTASF
jgi:uncharacterized protein (TIGR03083 family)